jgi:hypothetical protein
LPVKQGAHCSLDSADDKLVKPRAIYLQELLVDQWVLTLTASAGKVFNIVAGASQSFIF